MLHKDYYNFELRINGTLFPFPIKNLVFSMSESIYEFYSTVTLHFNDVDGSLQETMLFVEGAVIDLSFGVRELNKKIKLVVVNSSVAGFNSSENLGGILNLTCMHEWVNRQEVRSKAYQGKISSVIQEVIAAEKFSNVDIDETENNDIWYQPMINDARFIREILAKYAYSKKSNDSPFCMFIKSDNSFNFKHIDGMLKEKELATIYYVPETNESDITRLAGNLKKEQNSSRASRRRDLFSIEKATGALLIEEDDITQFPSSTTDTLLPILNDENKKTVFMGNGFKDATNKVDMENVSGERTNAIKMNFFLERLSFDLPLSKSSLRLEAGKSLIFKAYTGGQGTTNTSKSISGKYIIEQAKTSWLGGEDKGVTSLVVARKFMKIPNAYDAKKLLLQ